jgi:hypothetical protein
LDPPWGNFVRLPHKVEESISRSSTNIETHRGDKTARGITAGNPTAICAKKRCPVKVLGLPFHATEAVNGGNRSAATAATASPCAPPGERVRLMMINPQRPIRFRLSRARDLG